MKKTIPFIICGFLLYVGACNSQKSNPPDNKIFIGKIDSIYSKILNEERKIWVYIPTVSEFNPAHNYPVVYLLDGDDHFRSVATMIQHLSEIQRNMILPQMILIGIPNTDRGRDLSPSIDESSGNTSGFASFIEKELIPYVDSMYPTTQYRTLIGHSLGGSFVINTLINHNQSFNSYIAIDPSINKVLLKRANKVLKEKDFTENSLYLAIANSGFELLEDTSANNDYRTYFKFANYIDTNEQNNLNFAWKFYKDDDHNSVPLIAEYDGLRFIYDFYKFPDFDKLLNTSRPDSEINQNYQNISRILGYKIVPSPGDLSRLGYVLLAKKSFDKAHAIIKMLIDNYPPSVMSYNAMGDLYKDKGDTLKAIEYFEKSIALNPNDGVAKNILKNLNEKSKDKK